MRFLRGRKKSYCNLINLLTIVLSTGNELHFKDDNYCLQIFLFGSKPNERISFLDKSVRNRVRINLRLSNQAPPKRFIHFYKISLKVFKGLCLDSYGFYLVILLLGIWWAIVKFHIKPLGMTKKQGFRKDFYVSFLAIFFIPVELPWALQRYGIQLKGI